MTDPRPNLFTRDDTFFGVCEGLGEDTGIPANLIRLAFVPALFFFPLATIATYAVLGIVVLASRLIFPASKAVAAAPVAPVVLAAPVAAAPAAHEEALPLAA